jgi:hypothetical protein
MESIEVLLQMTYRSLNFEAQLGATQRQLGTVQKELDAVYASASWRITAPLRHILQRLC